MCSNPGRITRHESLPNAFVTLLATTLPAQPIAQPSTLNSQPTASTSRVLDLDGKDSYVELPANLFTNDVDTVEGWVKWRAFGAYSRFFEFADAALRVGIINFDQSSELAFQRVLTARYAGQTMSHAPGQLVLGQWTHVAVVTGTNFSKLYCNGHLLATSTTTNNWAPRLGTGAQELSGPERGESGRQ